MLKNSLPNKPKIIFKRAKCVKNIIAPSKLRPVTNISATRTLSLLPPIKGTFRCGNSRCKICSHIKHGLKQCEGLEGKFYSIDSFISCSTPFMVYGLSCPCGKLYVVSTIRPLRERFGEHRNNVKKCFPNHCVSSRDTSLPCTKATHCSFQCSALKPFHQTFHLGFAIKNIAPRKHTGSLNWTP